MYGSSSQYIGSSLSPGSSLNTLKLSAGLGAEYVWLCEELTVEDDAGLPWTGRAGDSSAIAAGVVEESQEREAGVTGRLRPEVFKKS